MKTTFSQDVKSYYDDHSRQSLADYVHGNPRLDLALSFVMRNIPQDVRRILDVGCGIGHSTSEIARMFPRAKVCGLDISAKMITIARRLFRDPNVEFFVADGVATAINSSPFDVITLIDVYEHISLGSRDEFHGRLRVLLATHGTVLMTFPSEAHQNHLRTSCPSELQPVDEDVTFDDIRRLAEYLGASVASEAPVSAWSENDYVHVVLARETRRGPCRTVRWLPYDKKHRVRHVQQSMAVRVTPDGTLVPQDGDRHVCVVTPGPVGYSETFIRAHIERIPAKVTLIYGNMLPAYVGSVGPAVLRPLGFLQRFGRRMGPRFAKATDGVSARFLAGFFRTSGIDVVLAEYGTTAVSLADACELARVPLVAHFHGFDAHSRGAFEQSESGYGRLFAVASRIVVVSKVMWKQLVRLGAPEEKLAYLPYGVDLDAFCGADPSNAPPIFVAVGRFVEKKAPHLTILAFKAVRDVIPTARLVMVGDGDLLGPCKRLVQALRLEGSVEFLGARRHPEVAAAMRRSRAFVQHSVTAIDGDSEGMPVAVLEAAASGLPVVSTNHAGIPEVITHGESGFLVDEGDLEGMSRHMMSLALDRDLAGSMGRAARERVTGNFQLRSSIDGLWRILSGKHAMDATV